MDQIKIGKFINQCRKEKKLTQTELAEKLNITDRAISKWENGICLPDSGTMLALCEILNITINDLFSGEKVDMNDYYKKAEQNLLAMQKLKEEADKRLLRVETIITSLTLLIYITLVMIVIFNDLSEKLSALILIPLTIFVFMICLLALRIEQQAGYYECQKCHHKYIPTYSSVFLAAHINRTRYMKCPKCHQRSWQRKVINKNN